MPLASTRGMDLRFVTCHQHPHVLWTCVSSHAASLHTWYGLAFRHMPPTSTRVMNPLNCAFALLLQTRIWCQLVSSRVSLYGRCPPSCDPISFCFVNMFQLLSSSCFSTKNGRHSPQQWTPLYFLRFTVKLPNVTAF